MRIKSFNYARLAGAFLLAALLAGAGAALAAMRTEPHAQLVAEAIAAAERGHWQFASKLARQSPDPVARKLVSYFYLISPKSTPSLTEFATFLDANPDWPGRNEMIMRAEHSLAQSIPPVQALQWFKRYKPLSIRGRFLAAKAFLQTGDSQTGLQLLRDLWVEVSLPLELEREILEAHGRFLTSVDHKIRFENLLWHGQRDAAQRMYRFVGRDLELLGRARLSLRYSAPDVQRAISLVPVIYRSDAGLFYERARWRMQNGKPQTALDLARETPRLNNPNGNAGEIWWKQQDTLTRLAIEVRDYPTAYRVAAIHPFTAAQNTALFAEAEWLAGWVSLRFLNKPEQALPHFTQLYEAVAFPAMRARGAYWAGRAAEASGDAGSASHWYAKAAIFPATFYGQLAAARGRIKISPAALDNAPLPASAEIDAFAKLDLARATRLLLQMKRDKSARQFFQALVDASKSGQSYRLAAQFAQQNNHPELGILAAKLASRKGVWLLEAGYPVVNLPNNGSVSGWPESALILAVVRQESNFNIAAVSSAGALGLMQLMPATAREVTRSLKVSYNQSLLTSDPVYNTRLGSFYLSQMLRKFDGSYVLALAAYNAGGGRANNWARLNGDPRLQETDVVDWIELIPFSETRNYVQRVMENAGVYRLRLGNAADPFRLEQDLQRGRAQAQSYDTPPPAPKRDPLTGTRTRS